MPISLSSRLLFAAIFAGCAGLMGFGLYLQHVENVEPCPLCILQRYAFVAAGLLALVAFLHNPRGWGRRVYAFLIMVAAGAGAGVAGRQIWLQHNPPKAAACGPDLEFMLDSFPLAQALPMLFKGTGDCAVVKWTFLGFSIPEWAIVCFTAIIASMLYLVIARRAA